MRELTIVVDYLLTLCEDVSLLPSLPKVPSDRCNKELNRQ